MPARHLDDPADGPADDPASVAPLRMGVLGCADIARRRMLPAMLRQPMVSLVAVASRSSTRAAAFADRFGCLGLSGYETLLTREDIDAVYLPLPPDLHAEWIQRSLLAGKHVLCEKPLTTDLGQARTAVALAEERGLLLMESFTFLHHSQHDTVRTFVADGGIGSLRGFGGEFTIPMRGARYASTLREVAVYPIRAAQLFLGDDLTVLAADTRTDADGVPVAGDALLRTPSGLVAHLRYGVDHGYRSQYSLWGSSGTLVLRRAFSTPDRHRPELRIERSGFRRKLGTEPDSQFVNILGTFARAISAPGGFRSQAEEIIKHAELVDAIARVAHPRAGLVDD